MLVRSSQSLDNDTYRLYFHVKSSVYFTNKLIRTHLANLFPRLSILYAGEPTFQFLPKCSWAAGHLNLIVLPNALKNQAGAKDLLQMVMSEDQRG